MNFLFSYKTLESFLTESDWWRMKHNKIFPICMHILQIRNYEKTIRWNNNSGSLENINMTKNFINDIITTVMWSGYNLQTRHKMRTRSCISSSACTNYVKLCQICICQICQIRILSVTSSSQSRNLVAIYRLGTKWRPDLVSQVLHTQLTSKFVTLSDMLGSQRNFINYIIMIFTWPIYNLQTRYKMRISFGISSSTCSANFEFVRYFRLTKELHQ